MGTVKAYLQTESGRRIDFQFNPAELTVSKRTQWSGGDAKGRNAPELRFQGGQSATMTLAIVVDSTDGQKSVTELTDALLALVAVDSSLPSSDAQRHSSRPPWLVFHWGPLQSFKAVVESLTLKFTYFASDGTPLRARCDLGLKQYADDEVLPRQNPTSGTPYPHTVHVLVQGERIDSLAARYYQDPTRWRLIADANDLDDPLRPVPGTPLVVPALPVQRREGAR